VSLEGELLMERTPSGLVLKRAEAGPADERGEAGFGSSSRR